jgi:hypothetical protein
MTGGIILFSALALIVVGLFGYIGYLALKND